MQGRGKLIFWISVQFLYANFGAIEFQKVENQHVDD
jgi:hypothetical protein